MTTEISKQKHPVPPHEHAPLVDRCLESYYRAERRRARIRVAMASFIYLAAIGLIAATFYYLLK